MFCSSFIMFGSYVDQSVVGHADPRHTRSGSSDDADSYGGDRDGDCDYDTDNDNVSGYWSHINSCANFSCVFLVSFPMLSQQHTSKRSERKMRKILAPRIQIGSKTKRASNSSDEK